MESIGARISKARRMLNLNQKELSQRANITEASLSRYENGLRDPKAAVLIKLAEALDVSTDYLLGITDDMSSNKVILKDEPKNDIEVILKNTEDMIKKEGIMFSGKPASKEAIDNILTGMKMGMLLAIEEESNKIK
ncbi:XRE family transcriptional regulator [Romboutsia weinsteinii]|uniref:XRE family transcriptional regulator n=1 Tax=Romboutsia weinsteinii TaxID=2020949 RepID=A0A371J1N0_9FIRM|nr:XRE family transcriptional regulator [Romboutsia weinsteinii]RDY26712.1 XRE family transcriptional regulator [Romboutsia weinsteinii]